MANEDFLNIWVVVHDKATNSLQTLSKNIRGVDEATQKLESSIGRMDKQQLSAAQNFLQLGKNAQKYTDSINSQIKARQDQDKLEERLTKTRAKREVEAYIEDIKRSKDASAAKNKLIEDDAKSYSKSQDQAIKDDIRWAANRLKLLEQAHKENHNFTERAIGDARRLAQENDRNVVGLGRLNQALDQFTNHINNSNKGAGIFRQNFAGLRVGIVGLIAVLIPAAGALVDLAGLLVAVADAAALAAAALGGALVASIAQAVPVIGLLILAFKQLFDIIKLTGQQQKNAGAAAHDAAQKSLTLAQRLEQERQAHLALANAQRQLITARRDAIRNIQDLNSAENAALLTSQRATLGLIGSQAALAGLVSGGGSALDVGNAQLDVSDASANVGTSRIALGRAQVDAARARSQGVSGNPQVIAAQQSISQQQRQLVLDARAYAVEQNKVSSATDTYRQALARLDPAQRKLFDSIVALRKEFKKDWQGITDPIINAFTGIVKGITNALKDPQIQSAFKGLSGATGSAITTSTSFFGTPEAKKLFLQVMKDARANLPLIAQILRDISKIFLEVAVAAGPFVHVILKDIRDFFDHLSKTTGNKNDLKSFFNDAFQAAKAFWDVITGIFDIFVALGQGGGAKTGVELVGQLGKYLHNIADELRGNKAGTGTFFDNLKKTVGDLGTILDHLFRTLIKIEQTGAFDTLLQVIDTFLIPALDFTLVLLGKIANAIGQFALHHKGITDVTLAIVGIGFVAFKAAGLVTGIFEAIQKVQRAYRILAGTQKAFEAAEAAKATAATASTATIVAENEVVIASEAEVAAAAEVSWLAMLGPIGLVILGIAAIGTAIYLLDKKFHFLGPTLDYIKKNWQGLLAILAPFTFGASLLALEIIKHWDTIKRVSRDLKNFLEPIFKYIAGVIALVYNHGIKQVLDGLGDLLKFLNNGGIDHAFSSVFGAVMSVINKVIGGLRTAKNILGDIANLGGLGSTSSKPPPGGAKGGIYGSGKGVGSGGTSSTAASSSNATSGNLGSVSTNIPVLATAASAIGVPYVYGGFDLGSGVDCSGLVYAAAKAHGIDIPRRSQEQAKIGTAESLSTLQPGDLLFYNTVEGVNAHEAIYAGDGNMLVASHTGTNVHVLPLDRNVNAIRRVEAFTAGIKKGGGGTGSGGGGGTSSSGQRGGASTSVSSGNSRGGHATSVFTGAGQPNLLTRLASGASVSVYDALGEIAVGFKNALGKNSPGYTLMIAAITALDQVFTNQARNLTRLVARQKHRLVSSRYRVSGVSGATSVQDTGSDAADDIKNLANLGIDRDSILNQLNETTYTLRQLQGELHSTPNNKKNAAKRQLLNATIKRYQDQQDNLTSALDQNTLDLVAAQNQIIQDAIDKITNDANRSLAGSDFGITLAGLTGIGRGGIPGLYDQKIATLQAEKAGLVSGPLAQAVAQGNTVLYNQIIDLMTGIDQAVAQAVSDKFSAVLDAINTNTSQASSNLDLQQRLAGLGGNSTNSLIANSAVLQQQKSLLVDKYNQTYSAFTQATNPADQEKAYEALNDLTAQLAENADAQRDNTEQLKQAAVDRITQLGSFRGGINSGVGGLVNSLAALNGTTDTTSLLKSLTNQKSNLQTTGSGLRGQLLSQFGINLSSDPNALIQQLNNTDFGAMEFGMDDNTKSTFEALINAIIENAGALVDNTVEIKKTTDSTQIQDWSSSLWANFRDALFTGNGGILNTHIPQAATGAHVLSAGLMRVHGGETVVPASVSRYQSSATNIEVNVDNRGEGDVDAIGLSKRLAWELKTK